MKLLLSQKNMLFDVIEVYGLSPSLFEYKEKVEANEVVETIISFKSSFFYFSISNTKSSKKNGFVKHSPGEINFEDVHYLDHWYDIHNNFIQWLRNIQREIQLEDKWEKLNNEIQSLQLYKEGGDFFNSKFTVPEYLEIKQRIFQLKEGISTLELLPEQISILNDKLDMVLDMTTQLGRFDWKGLFVGIIVSIIIQLEVTPDNAKAIWDLIKQVFHNYFIGQ
jgi:hypothetical protein